MAEKFRTASGYIEELDEKIQGNLSSVDGVLQGSVNNLLNLRGTVSPGQGPLPIVELGTVEDGTPLSITNTGTPRHAVLNFVIPASIDYLGQHDTVIFYCGSASEVV